MSGDVNRKLGITVEATDLASGKLSKVKGELAGIGSTSRASSLGFTGMANAIHAGAGRIGSALSTAKARLVGFGSSIGQLLGFGGLLGVSALLKDSVGKAQAFGAASLALSRVTGLSIDTTSRLVDALDYFGISAETQTGIAEKYEKAIAGIAATHKTAIAFQRQYGLTITDSEGRTLDYNKQLLASADYFNNKSIPASTKALALSKLYGKTWSDLIPILAQGRAGIQKAQADAMHMSESDLKALTDNRNATQAWNDELGDLETTIGIKLLPTLTDGLRGVTGWLSSHEDDVKGFFEGGLSGARTLASAASAGIGAISSAWSAIPAPVRDILIRGLVTDRFVKFAFGVSPIQMAVKFGEDALGGVATAVGRSVAGSLISSKLMVQHVWVDNMAAGMGPGGGGGKAGFLDTLMSVIGGAAVVDSLQHAPGVVEAFGQEVAGLANRDIPAASAAFQKLIAAMPDTNPFLPKASLAWLAGQVPGAGGATPAQYPGKAADDRIISQNDRAIDAVERARSDNATKLGIVSSSVRSLSPDLVDIRNAVLSLPDRIRIGGALAHVKKDDWATPTPAPTSPYYSTSGVAAGSGPHAAGGFWMTRGATRTPVGIAGEAGGEAIAIVRNPRPLHGLDNAASHAGNDTALARIEALLERVLRAPSTPVTIRSIVSARQTEAAIHRQHNYGPTRARQLSYSG